MAESRDEDVLRERTRVFALRVIELTRDLPRSVEASMIGICEQEADASGCWLERIRDGGMLAGPRIDPLHREADELRRIFTASRYTAQRPERRDAAGSQSKILNQQSEIT